MSRGRILSTYGAVLAQYAALTGSVDHRARGYAALALCTYAIDFDGCPSDRALETSRGGWQEDAHTDVIHNFVAAFHAFPAWAD